MSDALSAADDSKHIEELYKYVERLNEATDKSQVPPPLISHSPSFSLLLFFFFFFFGFWFLGFSRTFLRGLIFYCRI